MNPIAYRNQTIEQLEAELATLRERLTTAESSEQMYREAHAAWNSSEHGWVNLAALLGVPYEMTSSAEMIEIVKQLQARLETSKHELGNYAFKILDTSERVFDTEVVKFGDKSMPDPDELIHIWVSKTTELQAELAIQKLKYEGEFDSLIELDAERIGDIEDLRSRLATRERENEALKDTLNIVLNDLIETAFAAENNPRYTLSRIVGNIDGMSKRTQAALTTPPTAQSEIREPDGIDMMNIRMSDENLKRIIDEGEKRLKAAQNAVDSAQENIKRLMFAKNYKATTPTGDGSAEDEGGE